MKRLSFFLFFVFILTRLAAQEAVNIGTKHLLRSDILGEVREYWVHLPREYEVDSSKTFPVLYLLDGDRNFTSLVAIEQATRKNPFIIVGVLNTDRGRDMTPTNSLERIKGYHPNSGGADKFYRFLVEELRKSIDATYRTNSENMLHGHSLCGLFTLYTFLNHTDSFQAYVALDPSLWWDKEFMMTEFQQRWMQIEGNNRILYVAKSGAERNSDNQLKDLISEFRDEYLSKQPLQGLQNKYEIFENETHGSLVLPASIEAIKFITE
ncbi:MAG: alpha/beta hydrolase [Mangrovibacterium sp.]